MVLALGAVQQAASVMGTASLAVVCSSTSQPLEPDVVVRLLSLVSRAVNFGLKGFKYRHPVNFANLLEKKNKNIAFEAPSAAVTASRVCFWGCPGSSAWWNPAVMVEFWTCYHTRHL